MPYNHLLALGSSFASGPGIEPFTSASAGRSARNYPSVLAKTLGLKLTDRTASGATTSAVIATNQRVGLHTLAPQLHDVPTDIDLITITAGGNDVRYIGTMIKLAIAEQLATKAVARPLAKIIRGSATGAPSQGDESRVADSLVRVILAAQLAAPSARIVLVDYLTIIGPDTELSREAPFSTKQSLALGEFAATLAAGFRQAAQSTGVDLVAMSEKSVKHGLGSDDPWVVGLPDRLVDIKRRPPFHPNAAGMDATAHAVASLLHR